MSDLLREAEAAIARPVQALLSDARAQLEHLTASASHTPFTALLGTILDVVEGVHRAPSPAPQENPENLRFPQSDQFNSIREDIAVLGGSIAGLGARIKALEEHLTAPPTVETPAENPGPSTA